MPPATALELIRPRLSSISGFDSVSYREIDLATGLDSYLVEIDIPSEQISRVADSLAVVDRAVRRATALLEGYPLRPNERLPRVPPTIGGLVFTGVELSSFHVRSHPHGLSRETVTKGRSILFAVLVGISCNIAADYLFPRLPGSQPPPPTEPIPIEISSTGHGDTTRISLSVPPLVSARSPDYPHAIYGTTTTITIRAANGETVVITFAVR